MSRNVRAAATALALAGGVYLMGAAPAAASNMGFKLERSFDLVRRPNGTALQNIYWLSRNLFDGLGDVAGAPSPNNPCVGDATGPAVGNGIIDSDDMICDMWTARTTAGQAGVFTLTYIKREECTPVSRIATIQIGDVRFTGSPFALQRDIGYQVRITSSGPTVNPQNRAVVVGSHDPSFTGRPIVFAPNCAAGQTTNCCGARAPRLDLVAIPYHTMDTLSDEILCGLEGVDWNDVAGRPDICWDDNDGDRHWSAGDTTTGTFDGRVANTVSTFRNDTATNGPVQRAATIALGNLSFTGTRFDLIPGDAYLLQLSPGHTTTNLLSPHF